MFDLLGRAVEQWLTEGDFAPREHFAVPRNIFGCHSIRWECATCMGWVETRVAQESPHPPTPTENYLTPVEGAEFRYA